MRFDGRADLAIAAALGLALTPCIGAVAVSHPAYAWLCTAEGPQKSPAPREKGPPGCHACLFSRKGEEDEEMG